MSTIAYFPLPTSLNHSSSLSTATPKDLGGGKPE
jgi:hypothetical protein